MRGGGRAARAFRCGGGRSFDMRPNHRLQHVLFQRPLARRGSECAASSACMAACAGEDAPRVLSAAATVGHLICARTIGCGMCFFSARWREGGRSAQQHRRVCGVRGGGRAARAVGPMFDVCGTFFQSEAARRGGGIGGAVAAAYLAHGRPPRVGCAHVLPAASPARASASTAQSYPCLPPAFSCAPPPASPVRPIPARRMPCPPASRALRRPRSPCGLSLRPPASSAQPYPSVPRVLSVRRGKGGYWQGYSAAARVIRTVLSLRAAGFVRPPREGRILEVSQRVPCPPRQPARPPASSARPNPA